MSQRVISHLPTQHGTPGGPGGPCLAGTMYYVVDGQILNVVRAALASGSTSTEHSPHLVTRGHSRSAAYSTTLPFSRKFFLPSPPFHTPPCTRTLGLGERQLLYRSSHRYVTAATVFHALALVGSGRRVLWSRSFETQYSR